MGCMDILRLTLRQLQIFVAVARTGSTIAASAEVALSQSATSSAVNELERLLSLRLFDRAGKRLLLNDNGRALLPQAQALLDGAAQVERMAHAPALQLQALRIGASTTIADHVLPDVLSAFLGEQPRTAVAWQSFVSVANTARICERVAAFDLDIGLIEGPCHEPALHAERWLQDELVIVGAENAFPTTAGGERITVPALRSAVWLLREHGSGTREATDQALLPHLRGYRRSIELGSSQAIQHAAAAGLGIACLSRWVVADMLQAGRLRQLDTTLPRITRQCHWVLHRSKQTTPALQRLLTLLPQAALCRR